MEADQPTGFHRLAIAFRPCSWLVVLGACLFVVGLAWALSSPIGSSPDDDFHLGSTWCSATAPDELCLPTSEPDRDGQRFVMIPSPVAEPATCYAFNAEASAICQTTDGEGKFERSRANAGLYPGGFYALMGFLVTDDPVQSALSMRMLGWTISFALIAASTALARGRLRHAYVLALLATSIPLGLFLFASNNPSGVAIAGVGAFWCSSCVFMTTNETRRSRLAGIAAVVATAFALMSRADAGLYISASAASVFVFARGWRRPQWRRSALLALVAASAAIGLLSGSQTTSAAGGLATESTGRAFVTVLWYNLTNLPSLWTGSLGTWGLGYLDTRMPDLVSAGMVSVCAALVFYGLAKIDRNTLFAAAIAGASIVFAPLLILSAGRNLVGETVQPRYLLPMLAVVVAYFLITPEARAATAFSRAQTVTVGGILISAQSIALHANMRRYITGNDAQGFDLGGGEWWWTFGPGPMVIWAAGTASFGVCVVLCLRHCVQLNGSEPAKLASHDAALDVQFTDDRVG